MKIIALGLTIIATGSLISRATEESPLRASDPDETRLSATYEPNARSISVNFAKGLMKGSLEDYTIVVRFEPSSTTPSEVISRFVPLPDFHWRKPHTSRKPGPCRILKIRKADTFDSFSVTISRQTENRESENLILKQVFYKAP